MRSYHLAGAFLLSCGGDIGVKAPGEAICDGKLNEEEHSVDGPFDADDDGLYDGTNSDCAAAYDADDLDCDDNDETVGAPAYWYLDNDGDGWPTDPDLAEPMRGCEPEPGYVEPTEP